MTVERMEELAILKSLGALDGEDKKEFDLLLASGDEGMKAYSLAWEEVAVALAQASGESRAPDPRVKEKLLRRIQELHARERSLEGPGSVRYDHTEGIYTIYPERMEWNKHPVPGVTFKVLSESQKRGYVTMLMKVEPGTVFPEHHHSGEEECYILSGSIIVNGKRLGVGVLHHGDENSEHATLTTEEGALLLLVVAKEDYIPPVEA